RLDGLGRLLREGDGAPLHPPLPVPRRHRDRVEGVAAVAGEVVEEVPVRPAVPGLEGEDVHGVVRGRWSVGAAVMDHGRRITGSTAELARELLPLLLRRRADDGDGADLEMLAERGVADLLGGDEHLVAGLHRDLAGLEMERERALGDGLDEHAAAPGHRRRGWAGGAGGERGSGLRRNDAAKIFTLSGLACCVLNRRAADIQHATRNTQPMPATALLGGLTGAARALAGLAFPALCLACERRLPSGDG